jgi:hypothetical protein
MEALRKMTLMPAQRLEARVPAMRNKGRVRVGADGDLTLFDPARVADRATYRQPTLQPEGIRHVLVNGVLVVDAGKLVPGVAPGRAVRVPHRQTWRCPEEGLHRRGSPTTPSEPHTAGLRCAVRTRSLDLPCQPPLPWA